MVDEQLRGTQVQRLAEYLAKRTAFHRYAFFDFIALKGSKRTGNYRSQIQGRC
jgi:hypothetical protein